MTDDRVIAVLGGARETTALIAALPGPACVVWGTEVEPFSVPVPTVDRAPDTARGVLDATHPFDTDARADLPPVPYARFQRPLWLPQSRDRWTEVDDLQAALAAVPSGACLFAATGQASLAVLQHHDGPVYLRQLSADGAQPQDGTCRFLYGVGPFDVAGEVALFQRLGIEIVLARNVGGPDSFPKIAAARQLGLPVVLLRPPLVPAGPVVQTVKEAVAWAHTL